MKNLKHYFTLTCSVLLIMFLPMLAQALLVGQWTFESGKELKDLTGNFADLTLNGAKVENGKLDVGKDNWAVTTKYSGPNFLEKTMVSWAILQNLDVQMGSILTTQPLGAGDFEFDSIDFGELQPHRWCMGSGWFHRTQDLDPGFEEKETGKLFQIAFSFKDDGEGNAHIIGYRNGEFIGEYTLGKLVLHKKDDTQVIFGARWSADGAPVDFLDALIEEARVYNAVLSQNEIRGLALGSVSSINSRVKLATLWGIMKAK